MNIASILRSHATNQGAKTAVTDAHQSLSYQQLWSLITELARQLQNAGVGAGDRIGLAMPDHPIHLAAHFAVAAIGAVIVPIDHRWRDAEIVAAVEAFKVKVIASDKAIAGLPETARRVTLSTSVAGRDGSLRLIDEPGDLLISLSSGTTGKPKGALLSHRQFYERFVSQWVTIGFDSRDRFAIVTPLFFGAGRSFAMSLLVAGGAVHLAHPGMKPPELLAALQHNTISATFLPPTLLRRLLPLAGTSVLLPNLNYLLVSGEPLHADEAHQIRQLICPNLVGYYASSEGGGVSVLSSGSFAQFAHTVGQPTFRTEVDIVDNQAHSLPCNEVGRLRYRGPGVATHFIDAQGQLSTNDDGWFYPGDLAERLSSGHLVLRGRDKDVIIRAGVNIYPAEIEALLIEHPRVQEAAVVGQSEAERGQQVVACIVGNAEVSELDLLARERLAPYKVPSRYVRLEQLPKSAAGKIDKKKLQEQVLAKNQ